MSMLTLFESRYTLKGRYNIGNVSKTASMSMLTLFESRYYTLNDQLVKVSAYYIVSLLLTKSFSLPYIVQHYPSITKVIET